MVIREKALVREMKEAYKRGGYTVLVRNNGRTVICAEYWAVEIDNHDVPREVLSLMALHMGFLPEPGDAYTVYKGDKKPTVQERISEETTDWVDELDGARLVQEETPLMVKKTVLTYGGYNIWQQEKTRRILLLYPGYEQILYKTDKVSLLRAAICAADRVSRVFILTAPQIAEDKKVLLEEKEWATVT